MKLLRLKINNPDGFRSLNKGFEIHFLRDFDYSEVNDFNPYILAGRNGSGKSNVLEALANIFYHVDCMAMETLPDGFFKDEENPNGFDNKKAVIDAFEVEYFIPIPISYIDKSVNEIGDKTAKDFYAHIEISKRIGETPVFEWVNRSEFSDGKPVFTDRKTIRAFTPDYVLGYSSGENELLSLPFFRMRYLHFEEYKEKLIFDDAYGYPPKPEGRLIYLDTPFSQAILLANLLMQDKEVLKPFEEEVGLELIKEFRLVISLDKFATLKKEAFRAGESDKVNLLKKLKKGILDLKACATTFYSDDYRFLDDDNEFNPFGLDDTKEPSEEEYFINEPSEIDSPEIDEDSIGFPNDIDFNEDDSDDTSFSSDNIAYEEEHQYLILDYFVNDVTKDAFRTYFNSPLELFQLFQVLLALNAHVVRKSDKELIYHSKNVFLTSEISMNPLEEDKILRFKDLWISKKKIENPIFTKHLSDGEFQFLHSLGLCLLFKDENCLFLFDEPETHFNPDWKAKFITGIRDCFKTKDGEPVMREMLITTHSPFLVSDSEMSYVRVFEKNEDTQEVRSYIPDFQTFGCSINRLSISIFKKADTIGDYAKKRYDKYRILLKEATSIEAKERLIDKIQDEMGESVERVLFINQIINAIEKQINKKS